MGASVTSRSACGALTSDRSGLDQVPVLLAVAEHHRPACPHDAADAGALRWHVRALARLGGNRSAGAGQAAVDHLSKSPLFRAAREGRRQVTDLLMERHR